MLDLKWLVNHQEEILLAYEKRGVRFDIGRLIDLDGKRRQRQIEVENLRAKRNDLSEKIMRADEASKPQLNHQAKLVKEALELAEQELVAITHQLLDQAILLPNLPHESVPSKRAGDRVEKTFGEPREFDFPAKDHLGLGRRLDLIDIERAAKVSGSRFSYLKNEAVVLQFALIRWVMDKLIKKGFTPIVPPVLVREEAMYGTGFFPAEPNEYYKIPEDQLYLAGTAEVPLAAYHGNETFEEKDLPKKYVGYSSCFRREAGSYGRDSHGIFRVHQFDKVEMFVFASAGESWALFEELASLSYEIFSELELPFRQVTINAGELGAPNVKKYDFEVWLPSQKKYRELVSCSHDTDFQARRLNIRYKTKAGSTEFVHTLNNTALAIGRTLIAIFENYQQADGSVIMPKILHQYLPFEAIKTR